MPEKNESFPSISGWKYKNIWNHHLLKFHPLLIETPKSGAWWKHRQREGTQNHTTAPQFSNAVFQPCNDIIRFKPLNINMEHDFKLPTNSTAKKTHNRNKHQKKKSAPFTLHTSLLYTTFPQPPPISLQKIKNTNFTPQQKQRLSSTIPRHPGPPPEVRYDWTPQNIPSKHQTSGGIW